jgi:hypothetical protein
VGFNFVALMGTHARSWRESSTLVWHTCKGLIGCGGYVTGIHTTSIVQVCFGSYGSCALAKPNKEMKRLACSLSLHV